MTIPGGDIILRSRKAATILAILALAAVIFLLAGCAILNKSQTQKPKPQAEPPAPEMVDITLYYGNRDASDLVREVRATPKTDQPVLKALELLLTAPTNPDAVALIPSGTTVNGFIVKDKIAYVDFGGTIAKATGGSAQEHLLVMSIVNTLTEFKEIEKVQILIEGKVVETLYGHVSLDEPLSRFFPPKRQNNKG